MKLIFDNNYYWIDPDDDNPEEIYVTSQNENSLYKGKPYKSYAFNEDEYDTAMSERRYTDAAEMLGKFHLLDNIEDRKQKGYISSLRRNGQIIESVFSNITKEEDRDAVSFYDAVGKDNGLENLSSNVYADKFRTLKNELGGEGSTKLRVKFDNKKQTFLGIDWLAKDNPYDIDDLCNSMGIDKNTLRNTEGIDYKVDDQGNVILTFDKTHYLANKIIAHIPHRGTSGKILDTIHGNNKWFYGGLSNANFLPTNPIAAFADYMGNLEASIIGRKDWQGNPIGKEQEIGIHITGLDENNKEVSTSHHGDWTLRRIKSLLNDARDIKGTYDKELDLDKKVFSSTVGPVINYALEDLKNQQLSDTEFNKLYKSVAGEWDSFLRTFGTQDFEMYSTYPNDQITDNLLREIVDGGQKEKIKHLFTAVNPRHLTFRAMISNGKDGLLVTADMDPTNSGIEGFNKEREVAVFIPDNGDPIFQHVKEAIDSDPQIAATEEINQMQNWGYTYNFYNKRGTLKFSKQTDSGVVFKYTDKQGNEREVNSEEARDLIAKDNFIEYFANNIVHQYIGRNNNIVTTPGNLLGGVEAYYDKIEDAAMTTANQLMPNVDLKFANNQELTYKEIFAILHSRNANAINELFQNYNSYQQNKIELMLEVFNELSDALKIYRLPYQNQ